MTFSPTASVITKHKSLCKKGIQQDEQKLKDAYSGMFNKASKPSTGANGWDITDLEIRTIHLEKKGSINDDTTRQKKYNSNLLVSWIPYYIFKFTDVVQKCSNCLYYLRTWTITIKVISYTGKFVAFYVLWFYFFSFNNSFHKLLLLIFSIFVKVHQIFCHMIHFLAVSCVKCLWRILIDESKWQEAPWIYLLPGKL